MHVEIKIYFWLTFKSIQIYRWREFWYASKCGFNENVCRFSFEWYYVWNM